MGEKKIDFRKLEEARTQALQDQLKTKLKARQAGKDASLRRVVLAEVVEGQYEAASEILDDFMAGKTMFPTLVNRAKPHVVHAKDLINAVRLKRSFPNLSSLPMAKQQEILDHAVHHFEELKMTLKIVERLSRDEIVRDLRSTVWVVRSTVYVVLAILLLGFLLDMSHGLPTVCWRVFNDFSNHLFESLSKFI